MDHNNIAEHFRIELTKLSTGYNKKIKNVELKNLDFKQVNSFVDCHFVFIDDKFFQIIISKFSVTGYSYTDNNNRFLIRFDDELLYDLTEENYFLLVLNKNIPINYENLKLIMKIHNRMINGT